MHKVFIVYDYFYPAYKAGGPTQSLYNLAVAVSDKISVSVLCRSNDMQETGNLKSVIPDQWSVVLLPGATNTVAVWYSGKINKSIFSRCLNEKQPNVIYLNGIFSYRFVIIPLFVIDKTKMKVVLCPRGMLQPGALAGKWFKKKIYLGLLRLSGLVRNITWHATNAEEEQDIKRVFGKHCRVIVAANIPKQPYDTMVPSQKQAGRLRLVYLSLVAEKKNLLQVIKLAGKSGAVISLDIYGPIKDIGYWKNCEAAIAETNGRVHYKGDVRPELVQQTIAAYDALILLTKGENFGHALYESLSVGRPVITSYFTPWNELEEKKAGWNLDINDETACLKKLEAIAAMDHEQFTEFGQGSLILAKRYYTEAVDLGNYERLFGKGE